MFVPFLCIILLLFCVYHFYWKRRGLPPGPTPLPFVGNMLELFLQTKNVYQPLMKWHKKYGPVHTFWQGPDPIIAITDYNLIVDLYVKDGDSYVGRIQNLHSSRSKDFYGIILTEGDLWMEQRRFALHILRNLGLGKNIMQEKILVEISSLIEKVHDEIRIGTKEYDLASHLDVAVGSIINNLLFGYRFEQESISEFHKLKTLLNDLDSLTFHPLTLAFRNQMEYIKYIPILNKYYYAMKNTKTKLYDFFENQVNEHQMKTDHNSEPIDYVEAFLQEKYKKEAVGSEDANHYSMTQLINAIQDLWAAGQDSTSSNLKWGTIFLMQEQEIQLQMQKEIDSVIGSDRLILINDRPNLPYTSAVVNEIQRRANIMTLNVPHKATRDVNIRGYKIPKGTTVLGQFPVLNYDEKIFPNPLNFDPTRFLDSNGHLKQVDEFIPFSIGKRACLGQGLAKVELFLFIANIFNQFKIKTIASKPPDTMPSSFSVLLNVQPFLCHIEKRNSEGYSKGG